jgi:predicted HAD superfamily Cof-like phosphohydrolase
MDVGSEAGNTGATCKGRRSQRRQKEAMIMSSKTRYEDMRAFHEACGLPIGDMAAPGLMHGEARFRAKLILEEVAETLCALGLSYRQASAAFDVAFSKAGPWPERQGAIDLVELADGLARAARVIEGTAVQAGLPSEEVWHDVQRSNMAKAGAPVVDEKPQKLEGWAEPDIAGVLPRARRAAKK